MQGSNAKGTSPTPTAKTQAITTTCQPEYNQMYVGTKDENLFSKPLVLYRIIKQAIPFMVWVQAWVAHSVAPLKCMYDESD